MSNMCKVGSYTLFSVSIQKGNKVTEKFKDVIRGLGRPSKGCSEYWPRMWWVWVGRTCEDIFASGPPHTASTCHSNFMVHSKPGPWPRGPGCLCTVYMQGGMQPQDKHSWCLARPCDKMYKQLQLLSSYHKENIFLQTLNLQFSWKLKNLQQLHFDFKTCNFGPKLFLAGIL